MIEKAEMSFLKKEIPSFKVGDTVRVVQKVTESGKTRSQAFEGIVIAKKGRGIQLIFTVRRISFGEGMEKTFPLHSPAVQSITVTRPGKARKAKLYYLRHRTGKQSRIEAQTVEAQPETSSI